MEVYNMKRIIIILAAVLLVIAPAAQAATPLDFNFEGDTVGAAAPSGWAGEQAADLSVALDASDWFGQGTGNKIARYTDLNSGDNGVGYTAFTGAAGDFFTITFDYYMPTLAAANKVVLTALGIDDLAGDNERNAKIAGPNIIDSLVTVSMLVNESGSTKTFVNPLTSTTVDLLDGTFISFQYENGVYTVKNSGGPPIIGTDLLYAGVNRFGFKTSTTGIRDFYFDDVVLHDNMLTVFAGGAFDFDPTPGDEAIVSPANPLTLSWSLPDCNNVADLALIDVWWDTNAAGDSIAGTTHPLIGVSDANTVNVSALDIGTYYWKIVATDPNFEGSGTSGVLETAVYSLTTGITNVAPVVDAGADIVTWLVDGVNPVTEILAGAILSDDGVPEAAGTTWTVVNEPDYDNNPIVIADTSSLTSSVTMSVVGQYTLRLTGHDTELDGAPDDLVIDVYANGCEAAKIEAVPPYSELLAGQRGDTNWDCIVNLADLAVMAKNWMTIVSN
jgi:hypothetical protein